jgi:hypothetical protein
MSEQNDDNGSGKNDQHSPESKLLELEQQVEKLKDLLNLKIINAEQRMNYQA